MNIHPSSAELAHPIQVVSRRTGLSAYVLRAWERRYAAVAPRRSASGRRLYSDTDIERLQWLQRATRAGRRIGDVASLPRDALVALCGADESATATDEIAGEASRTSGSTLYRSCLGSIYAMSPAALEAKLYQASSTLDTPELLTEVLAPLMGEIGEAYRCGRMRISQEHMASATIRSFMGTLRLHNNADAAAPRIVVTTPAGQVHELGACMVAATAASEGWNAAYLGPDTPAEEIAVAAARMQASAVALSLIYPADDPRLPTELRLLRQQLPPHAQLLVGGRAHAGYAEVLKEIGATVLDTLPELRMRLAELRGAAEHTPQ